MLYCSCDQSLVTLTFLWEKLSRPQFFKDLTRRTPFFEGWSWFKLNNWQGLALGTNLKFYTSVGIKLKLKVRKFWGLIPAFIEVTGEKLVRGGRMFAGPPSWIVLRAHSFDYCLTQIFHVVRLLILVRIFWGSEKSPRKHSQWTQAFG